MTLEEARAFFKEDVYATEVTGAVLQACGPNYAKCTLSLTPRHRNAAGQVMGGMLFTLADFAFAVAANNTGVLTVTAVSQISFLSAVRGSVLTAETRLLKDGRRSCFFQTDITDELGTPVAVVTATGTHLEK